MRVFSLLVSLLVCVTCLGALSTDTSYFLNVEAITNVSARSSVRGLTGVFTNGVNAGGSTFTSAATSLIVTNTVTNSPAFSIEGMQGHGTNPVATVSGGPLHYMFDDNTTAGINPRGIINDSVDNTVHGVHWSYYKARGSRASKASLQNGDFIGGLVAYGYNVNNQYIPAGAFAIVANGTISSGVMPTTAYISAVDSSGVLNFGLIVTGDGVGVGFGSTSVTPASGLVPAAKFHVRGNSSTLFHDSYSSDTAGASFYGRKARGTVTSPSQVLADDNLTALNGRGYHSGGAFGTVNVGLVGIYAAENFTSTAQGTYMTVGTTPTGSTTRAERLRVTSSGNFGIATTAPTSTLHVAGSQAHSIATGTSFTLTGTNEVYLVNVDAQTVTLPTAVGVNGRSYTVKTIAPAETATIATTSSQLIDGASTYSLTASNKFVRVISDNARWWVIGNN